MSKRLSKDKLKSLVADAIYKLEESSQTDDAISAVIHAFYELEREIVYLNDDLDISTAHAKEESDRYAFNKWMEARNRDALTYLKLWGKE